jgi:hypothetical protein
LLGLQLTLFPGRAGLELGAWLCDPAGRPVVHVGHVAADYGDGRTGSRAERGSGAVHHIAFDCADYDGMLMQLSDAGRAVRTNEVTAIGLRQIFVDDPNGVTVELNFRGE